jgi:hypothetical protein
MEACFVDASKNECNFLYPRSGPSDEQMEKGVSNDNRMLSETSTVLDKEGLYDDLIGVEVIVPCSTWDHDEAVKCWGDDYDRKTARGVIRKVSLRRKGKEPRFEIEFPEKPGQNSFIGFDIDYVMSYSEEVPLRYHNLKADHIMKCAKKAELAMLNEALSSQNAKAANQDSQTESDTAIEMRKDVAEKDMDLKMPADNSDPTNAAKKAGPNTKEASNTENKKRRKASTTREAKKNKTTKKDEDYYDGASSAEA